MASREKLIGQATLIFGSGVVVSASQIQVRYTGTTLTAPDSEEACAAEAKAAVNRSITITCKVSSMTPQILAWLFGANSGQIVTDVQRNVTIIRPNADDPKIDEGPVSLVARRLDGKEVRFYIPRAAVVAGNDPIAIGKGEFAVGTLTLESLSPEDGSNIPYYIEVEN